MHYRPLEIEMTGLSYLAIVCKLRRQKPRDRRAGEMAGWQRLSCGWECPILAFMCCHIWGRLFVCLLGWERKKQTNGSLLAWQFHSRRGSKILYEYFFLTLLITIKLIFNIHSYLCLCHFTNDLKCWNANGETKQKKLSSHDFNHEQIPSSSSLTILSICQDYFTSLLGFVLLSKTEPQPSSWINPFAYTIAEFWYQHNISSRKLETHCRSTINIIKWFFATTLWI